MDGGREPNWTFGEGFPDFLGVLYFFSLQWIEAYLDKTRPQLLGHARLDTTQIYTEVAINALKEAHARTHPSSNLRA